MIKRSLMAIAVLAAAPLIACNPQTTTAGSPPATSRPVQQAQVQTLSVADFAGQWKGESEGKKPLEMVVTPQGAITYKYSGMDLGAGAPKIDGKTMTFSITGGQIAVTKVSDTKLDWRYSGAYPSSRSVMTKVSDLASIPGTDKK